jgi:hypothetical protein
MVARDLDAFKNSKNAGERAIYENAMASLNKLAKGDISEDD